jgi:hypothetical protein
MPVSQTWIAFVAVVPLAVISVLVYLIRARRERGRPNMSGDVVLEYGRVMKAFPAVMVLLWAILLGSIAFVEPPQASDAGPILGIVALVTALLLPLTIEVRGVGHRLSSQGIERVSPWSSPATIPWRDVRSVTYDPLSYWFVVDSPRGKVRLSRLLDGLADFQHALEANVPRERWAPAFGQVVIRPSASSVARPGQAPARLEGQAQGANRMAGGMLLFVGAVMVAATWYWAVKDGLYPEKLALFGPMCFVIGAGLLIHGNAMERTSVNRLSRIYAFAGTVAGLAYIYFLSRHVDWILLLFPLIWLLPGWLFGGDRPKVAAASPRPTVAYRPIRPR